MLLSVRTSSSFMLYFHRKIQYTFLLKSSTQVCLSTQCVSSVVCVCMCVRFNGLLNHQPGHCSYLRAPVAVRNPAASQRGVRAKRHIFSSTCRLASNQSSPSSSSACFGRCHSPRSARLTSSSSSSTCQKLKSIAGARNGAPVCALATTNNHNNLCITMSTTMTHGLISAYF